MKPLALLAIIACGCSTVTITTPTGYTFRRTTFASETRVGSLTLEGPDGERLTLRAYGTDISEQMRAIASGIAEGAVKGAKP
jgi:hypothetical protein